MSTVIPKLQGIIAGPMQEAGFPPPPMGERWPRISAARPQPRTPRSTQCPLSRAGMMQGMMAFTQASQLEGGAIITEGMGVLQKGMMGTFPSEDELDALLAKLK